MIVMPAGWDKGGGYGVMIVMPAGWDKSGGFDRDSDASWLR